YVNLVAGRGVVVLFNERLTAPDVTATREFLASWQCSILWAIRAVEPGVATPAGDHLKYVTYTSPAGLERVFEVFQELLGRVRASHVLQAGDPTPAALLASVADLFGPVSEANTWVRAVRTPGFAAIVRELRDDAGAPDAAPSDDAAAFVGQLLP